MPCLEYQITRMQFSLFRKYLFSPQKNESLDIINDLNRRTEQLFDGEPILLPYQSKDNPVLILKSQDNIFECQIIPSRINFFYTSPSTTEESISNLLLIEKFISLSNIIYEYFREKQNLKVGRIGFVTDFFNEYPAESSNKIIRDSLIKDSSYFATVSALKISGISFTFTEEEKLGNMRINKMVNVQSLRQIENPNNDHALLLKYDINTVIDDFKKNDLTSRDIGEIMNVIKQAIIDRKINKFIEING